MSERRRLPNRRGGEICDFMHAGRLWTLTIGRLEDGSVGELFIVASLALQSGCPLEILRHAKRGRSS
jgi:hypothetical protein